MHENDSNRSIPLPMLRELLALPFEFHSVQKDVRPEDTAELAANTSVRWHLGNINDFTDAAALISEMDLVITVDTAAAHVAGALAKPVWILLPFAPDWRWMLERTDSPWYPTARLFRQPKAGDWAAVLRGVISALADFEPTRRSEVDSAHRPRN